MIELFFFLFSLQGSGLKKISIYAVLKKFTEGSVERKVVNAKKSLKSNINGKL